MLGYRARLKPSLCASESRRSIWLTVRSSPDKPISPTSARSGSTRWFRYDEAIATATAITVPTRYEHRRTGAHTLTAREREVLRLRAGMHTDQEIARALSLSRHTISGHVPHILANPEVETRRAAVARSRELGLLPNSQA